MLSAVGHQHLGHLRPPTRVALGLLHERRLQLWKPTRRRVLVVHRVLTGGHGGSHDVVRRRKVGLAGAEADDRLARRTQLTGLVGDGHGRRLGDGTDTG